MNDENWKDNGLRCFGMLIDGRAESTVTRERGSDATIFLIFNSHHEPGKFVLPPAVEGVGWQLLLTTSDAPRVDRVFQAGETFEVANRSVSVFLMC
jgi:glycogen operon protein